MITISVTEQDIKDGLRGDNCFCPVARATRRVIKGHLTVESSYMTLRTRKGLTCIETPKIVQDFISAFDSGNYVEPISFELEELDKWTIV